MLHLQELQKRRRPRAPGLAALTAVVSLCKNQLHAAVTMSTSHSWCGRNQDTFPTLLRERSEVLATQRSRVGRNHGPGCAKSCRAKLARWPRRPHGEGTVRRRAGGTVRSRGGRGSTASVTLVGLVQWSEDVIKADPFFERSRVRFRVPPLGFEHNCT